MKHAFLVVAMVVAAAGSALAGGQTFQAALKGAASSDPAVVRQSVDTLRQAGPAGLEALLKMYAPAPAAEKLPEGRMMGVIDAVAGQHDAVWSRLYWYTDLGEALAAAKKEGKPILYLRLMGKLTDEYSCANSRYFRTVLYANGEVSKLLRERFVLVWVSERPVPVVTIDYGDGRVLKRTITGNSIHYVLDADGRVVDALPGLYGPKVFERILREAYYYAAPPRYQMSAEEWGADRHAGWAEDEIQRAWEADIKAADPEMMAMVVAAGGDDGAKADAASAAGRAMCKSMVETPLLRAAVPQFAAALDQSIGAADMATWQKVAARHAAEAQLDESSIALICSQNPSAYADGKGLDLTVRRFEQMLALDTVRDDYLFRRQILGWLAESQGKVTLEDLNRRVYSELFLTPRSDPWLGLVPEATYSALCDDGCQTALAGR